MITDFGKSGVNVYNDLSAVGYFYDPAPDKWNMSDGAPDFIYLGENEPPFELPNGLRAIYDYKFWAGKNNKSESFPLFFVNEYLESKEKSSILNFIVGNIHSFNNDILNLLKADKTTVIVLETDNLHGMPEQRRVFIDLLSKNTANPVIIKRNYNNINFDELRLFAATDLGGLLIDGFGDGVWVNVSNITESNDNNSEPDENILVKDLVKLKETKEKVVNRVLFGILQAARTRIPKPNILHAHPAAEHYLIYKKQLK